MIYRCYPPACGMPVYLHAECVPHVAIRMNRLASVGVVPLGIFFLITEPTLSEIESWVERGRPIL